jgi:outer membrane protein OmpA-like peptidoglycan-associated protein
MDGVSLTEGFDMNVTTFSKGMLGLVCVAGLVLGGCANKKKSDLAMQEAAELRERNASLEQSNRDKDSRIAELEARGAMQPAQPIQVVQAAPVQTPAPANDWGNSNSGNSGTIFESNGHGQMVATLAGSALFDSGQASLKSTAKKDLDRVVAELKKSYRNASVRVEGHTDSDPIKRSNWRSNDELSQARADAVMRYLSSKGISTDRMTAIGYGSSKPKGSKQASRRVEVIVSQ